MIELAPELSAMGSFSLTRHACDRAEEYMEPVQFTLWGKKWIATPEDDPHYLYHKIVEALQRENRGGCGERESI